MSMLENYRGSQLSFLISGKIEPFLGPDFLTSEQIYMKIVCVICVFWLLKMTILQKQYWAVGYDVSVILPGFQKGRDKEKGREQFWPKKGREQFWAKRAICVVQGKTWKN
jgi:hypothetical protein